jgi:hypothetical protein
VFCRAFQEIHMPTKTDTIDELMSLEARGMRAGICGREFCEACGNAGSFTGFWGAFLAHSYDGRFVCAVCRQGELGRGEGLTSADYAKLDELILTRGFRYCAGCGVEVELDGASAEAQRKEARRRPYTCEACGEIDAGAMGRRRYLEHEASKPEGLERAEARLRWAKAGIERMEPTEEE